MNNMKIKPILFNTDMVRALLTNRKTVTRRVVKLKYSNTNLEIFTNKYGTRLIEKQNEEPGITTIKNPDGTTTHTLLACIEKTPPYRPGDILYVQETWTVQEDIWNQTDTVIYRADYSEEVLKTDDDSEEVVSDFPACVKWRPSIHMPREAARIFLKVTEVGVQQVKDITDEEAASEGFASKSEFISVFLKIYPDCTEDSWCWVIRFERIEKPPL